MARSYFIRLSYIRESFVVYVAPLSADQLGRFIYIDVRQITELGRRLMEVPGIGPLVASALVACVLDPAIFRCGRNMAAWMGLVPRQSSSGGKERLGSITKAGNGYLRQMLFTGAMAVIRRGMQSTRRTWISRLLERRAPKVRQLRWRTRLRGSRER